MEYLKNVNGIITKNFYNEKINFVEELDNLSFPAWEDFPLENYWALGYSHGPLSEKKYLPIKNKLKRQLMNRLKKLRDPRVLGDGTTFDKPPYVVDLK